MNVEFSAQSNDRYAYAKYDLVSDLKSTMKH